jgi:hypothetical protein
MSLLQTHQNKFGSTDIGSVGVKGILIKNHKGDKKDIRELVHFLHITESIELVGIILELGIRDESNFFELFEITGHETIEIELEQKRFQDNKEIATTVTAKVEFHVTDYPEYAKLDDNQVQTYTITATTRALWLSPLKKISRAVNSDIIDIIKTILIRDLQYPAHRIIQVGESTARMRGILNWNTPLSHINRLKSHLADSKFTQYFIHEILTGTIQIKPLSFMADEAQGLGADVYRTFWDQRRSMNDDPGSWKTQLWNLSRINSLNSSLGIAQIGNAMGGMFASEWNIIDPMQKTRYQHIFNYDKDTKSTFSGERMKKPDLINSIVDDENGVNLPPMTELPQAHMRYMFQNEFQDGGGALARDGLNQIISANGRYLQSHNQALTAVTHDLDVPGDLALNPGKVIDLRLPKSTDPSHLKTYADTPAWQENDLSLGGKFIIWGVVHNIDVNGAYTSSLTVRKDHI